MKILDNIAIKIAEHINTDKEELLLNEIARLERELATKDFTINEITKKYQQEYEKTKTANKQITELDTLVVNQINTIKRLEKKRSDINNAKNKEFNNTKLKDRCNQLAKDLEKSEKIRVSQRDYIDAIRFLIDTSNTDKIKTIFSHNLTRYMTDTGFGNTETAEKIGVAEAVVRYLKNGSKKLTVDKFDCVVDVLCEHFKCTAYELVSEKVECE